MGRVFVLGIDGAPPDYFFKDWLDELPNIKKLMTDGCYAELNSTIPNLSVVAWSSITTGKPPADTGVFEYVYRENYSYTDIRVVTSRNIRADTLWQIASNAGKKSIVCFVVMTWPIKPFNGLLIAGPIFPDKEGIEYTYPKELKDELEKNLKTKLLVDIPSVKHYRTMSKEDLIKEAKEVTRIDFESIKYLIKNKEWDLFWGFIGPSDRLNHTFWRYMDPLHRRYEKESKYKDVLKNYYKSIDSELGEIMKLLDKDTKIIVLSDHGITRMHNRINLTDWLIQNNYMVLKYPIKQKCEFKPDMVDWEKTKIFAIGAYEAQIFVNLKGREPKGIVEKKDYGNLLNEVEGKLRKITGDDGSKLDTKIFKKGENFKGKHKDIAPDMIVYFDNLHYGCNNSLIGNSSLWGLETAKGGDDACHSLKGIFVMDNKTSKRGYIGEIDNLDVVPTVLKLLDVEIPTDLKGKAIS